MINSQLNSTQLSSTEWRVFIIILFHPSSNKYEVVVVENENSDIYAKLSQIGVEERVHDILSSYLTNRKQVVVVENEKSDILEVKAGVPQAQGWGPMLFMIYLNDITEDIESDILFLLPGLTQQKLLLS